MDENNNKLIEYLQFCGYNVNSQHENGHSLLELISIENNKYISMAIEHFKKELTENNFSFVEENLLLCDPFYWAMKDGDVQTVSIFLNFRSRLISGNLINYFLKDSEHLDYDQIYMKCGDFLLLACSESKEMIRTLLKFGIRPSKYNLRKSVERDDDIEIISIYYELCPKTVKSHMPLLLFVSTNLCNYSIAKFLLSKGANPNEIFCYDPCLFETVSQNNVEMFKFFIEYKADINAFNSSGDKIIHNAIKYGGIEILNEIVILSPDINSLSRKNRTPIYLAAKYWIEIIDMLLELGGDPTILDFRGQSPLHQIVRRDDALDKIELFLNAGIDINIADVKGFTPLHRATKYGQVNNVLYLVNKGADLNVANKKGLTPLHCAIISGKLDCYIQLLDKGANPNIGDKNGVTAFNLLVRYCILDERNYPFDKYGTEEITEFDGVKSIHQYCRLDHVLHSLDKGANPNIADHKGITARSRALESENINLINMFQRYPSVVTLRNLCLRNIIVNDKIPWFILIQPNETEEHQRYLQNIKRFV